MIDIGVHCGLPAPAEVGGGAWTYDKAWQFLTSHANMGTEFLRYELDRYLGWPGQAPSFKVGERLWLQLRDETRAREGADFNLKAFHRRALDLYTALAADDPAESRYRQRLAANLSELGNLLTWTPRRSEADELYRRLQGT